jgi:hypothetical protein
MKTYPVLHPDGSVKGFSISNSFWWGLGTMRRLLESVDGVANFRKNWFNEYRYSFAYRGRACVVHEPWGDSDQYWIRPVQLEPPLDLGPIHRVFENFRFSLTFDREFRE